jgi:ABC-type multidrug transport system fused ATPase/permease subunit
MLLTQANAKQNYINNIPRIVIENLLFFVFAFYIFLQKFNIIGGSSFLAGSVLLIAILRLTPSLYRAIILMSSSTNPHESLRLVQEALNFISGQEEINSREEKKYVSIGQLNDIKIQGLNFSFVNNKGNLKVIFDGLNCQMTAPGMYGITGKSGSGKSTLLELILGFRNCTNDEECVYINGIPLNSISRREWYKKISYIPQHSTFFEGTILENICVNFEDTNANVDLERVSEIIKLVKLTELINNFDLKLDHKLEQNARNISGGQRQRLALARALYKSPELLILDESTNALDSETEAGIFEDLKKISEKVLIIFVAHNKNVYKHCKGIIDLKK